MAKYIYPAIFTKEDDGGYSVVFPDLESCYTCGDTLEQAMDMAEDCLALVLYGYETDQKEIPTASSIDSISTSSDEFVSLIKCDTLSYRKQYSSKAVKKTLTIPEWMNDEGMRAGINFSQLLQDALMQKIGIR
ncbi:MAG: type II toxin-antitoxin system HicB family antitoxin [Clostridium sp.]|nr:type II toxin-antitoxin system HicB family antitoxin [Clostridium sp.]